MQTRTKTTSLRLWVRFSERGKCTKRATDVTLTRSNMRSAHRVVGRIRTAQSDASDGGTPSHSAQWLLQLFGGGHMPRGSKAAYTQKQKRQAEHIEEGYEQRG